MAERELISDHGMRLARETLLGDMRDGALNQIKKAISWQAFHEAEQQEIIDQVTNWATDLLERAVSILAQDGRDSISATIQSVTIRDGIKLTLTCALSGDNLAMLGENVGAEIQIVHKSAAAYQGTRGPVYPDKDQPELPLAGRARKPAKAAETEKAGTAALNGSSRPQLSDCVGFQEAPSTKMVCYCGRLLAQHKKDVCEHLGRPAGCREHELCDQFLPLVNDNMTCSCGCPRAIHTVDREFSAAPTAPDGAEPDKRTGLDDGPDLHRRRRGRIGGRPGASA